jgi:subtilisin-like proprotein convertase family protein
MKCQLSLYAILSGMALFPILLLAQSSPCGLNAPILDNSCTASSNFTIPVSGINGTQLGTDVILQEVRFIISHTWDNDLDIFLRSPSGIWVELSTDNGGGADHYGDPSDNTCTNVTRLRMNACTPIVDGVAPFIGEFIPEGDFADFYNGTDPEGTWIIRICDDAQNDVGYLHFVELVFAEMSCPPVTNLYVDTLSGNVAGISWTTTGTCVNTLLEYGPVGFQPGTGASANEGTVLTLNCPVALPYTISGLDDLTTYEVYIRTACTNGGYDLMQHCCNYFVRKF